MTLVMYERIGLDGRRPSPFSRRIRYALAHKGAEADFIACLVPEDHAYFRSSREKAFGKTLEAASAERAHRLLQFETACLPPERLLAEQKFVAGDEPRYADYILFSVFQWARLGCPLDVVKPGSAIAVWRATMIALHDGLGDRFPGYPA